MDLANETHALIELIFMTRMHGGKPTSDLDVTVVFKATYDLTPSGDLVPSRRRLPILAEPMKTPFGVLGGDRFARKSGADFCVLGTVRLPVPTREHRITARLGGFASALSVYGDRRWKRTGSGLGLTEPEPFTEMPLSYRRAFGGVARMDDLGMPNQDNPAGTGFYLEEGHAEENLAPNVVDADDPPIAAWTDRPRVAGWGPYPFFWGLRAGRALNIDGDGKRVPGAATSIHNHAHPRMVLDSIAPRSPVRIEGLTPRPVAFDVPEERFCIRASVGGRTVEALAEIDGLYLWADPAKVVVTQRAHFESTFRRGERRTIVATAMGAS